MDNAKANKTTTEKINQKEQKNFKKEKLEEKKKDYQVQIQDINEFTKEMKIIIDKDVVNKEFLKNYKQLKNSVQVKGFRKGRVPISILRLRFGKIIAKELTEHIVKEYLDKVLKEYNIETVDEPDIKFDTVIENKDFQINVTYHPLPPIKFPDFSTLEIIVPEIEVKQSLIDEVLQAHREKHSYLKPVDDRPAKIGDVLYIKVEAKEKETGEELKLKNSESDIELGKDELIPGSKLDLNLVGKKAGDVVELEYKFPENFESRQDLSNKEAIFKVKIEEVKEKVLPELTDDFVKKIDPNLNSLDELIEKTRERIRAMKMLQVQKKLEQEILNLVVERAEFEPNEYMIEKEIKTRKIDLNEVDDDTLNKLKENIKKDLKKKWVTNKLIKHFNLKVTESELKNYLINNLSLDEKSLDNFIYNDKNYPIIEAISKGILHSKLVDTLKKKINIKVPEQIKKDEDKKESEESEVKEDKEEKQEEIKKEEIEQQDKKE